MASDDIAVPDLAYFIEHDIREAIRQMDEAGLSAHALEASSALGDPALSSISPTQPLLPPKPVKSEPKVKPKKPRKKKKAAKGADGTKGVRKFVSPYAVFSDVRTQAIRAAQPGKEIKNVWKQIAVEWGKITTIEKAPFKKEFEERRRLYELENAGSAVHKADRSARKGRPSTFRFAPNRRVKEQEISRVEHLPHCPIVAKRKVYEESVLQPFVHPRQAGCSSGSSSQFCSDDLASQSCSDCPKTYAVCGYCRELGLSGPMIFHFESDCWKKAQRIQDEKYRPFQTSKEGREVSIHPDVCSTNFNSSQRLLSTASGGRASLPDSARACGPSITGPTINLDELFGDEEPLQTPAESSTSFFFAQGSSQGLPHFNDAMPDLSVVDAFLADAGLKSSSHKSSFW